MAMSQVKFKLVFCKQRSVGVAQEERSLINFRL